MSQFNCNFKRNVNKLRCENYFTLQIEIQHAMGEFYQLKFALYLNKWVNLIKYEQREFTAVWEKSIVSSHDISHQVWHYNVFSVEGT